MNTHITSMEDVIEHYSSVIKNQADGIGGNTVIMGGHQVLGANGDLTNLGVFPEVTAEVARSIQNITSNIASARTQLFTLIDDKRWLESTEIREKFWEHQSNNNAPLSIGNNENQLESFALGKDRIQPGLQGLWSEKALMAKFSSRLKRQKGLKKLVNREIAEILAWETGNGIEKEACMSDGCNINGCSREVIEMLSELSRRGIERLIMLVPNSCETGINHACEIACNNPEIFFKNKKIVVHNCFVNSGLARSGGTPPKTVHEVFANCTTSTHQSAQ